MHRCKASEIPRNEAWAKGSRHKAKGTGPNNVTPFSVSLAPCTLRHLRTSQ
jgi:hypothetical protein